MKRFSMPMMVVAVLGACGHPDQEAETEADDVEETGTVEQGMNGGPKAHDKGYDKARDTVYQAGTFDDLATSHFTGEVPYREVVKHGDFGVGTMSHVDGEMIALDGVFYSIRDDLVPRRVDPKTPAPFAQVTYFSPDSRGDISSLSGIAAVQTALAGLAPDLRTFYAFKAEGTFSSITVRSIHRQEEPYPPIGDVIATQVVRVLTNVRGTMLGFRTPPWAGATAFAGYHFHFITHDRKLAGHVLDVSTDRVKVEIDDKHNLSVDLLGQDNDRGKHH